MKRWPTKPLGELIAIEKGKKAPKAFADPTPRRLKYLQIEDLRPDANVKYCEPFSCPRATKSDVIIAWDGANAGTVSCNLEGHIGSTLAILRPIPANTLSAPFLSRFLEGQFSYLQRTATGATIPHISKSALAALQLPLPPLSEQERIVNLLDEADELRKLRAQAERRTAKLIPSIFHEMFGDVSKNSMNWSIVRFDEIGDARLGKMLDAKQQTGKHKRRYLRNANVQWDRMDIGDVLEMDFPEKDREEFRLHHGDLLICEGGEVGRTAIWRDELPECYFQKALHRVRLHASRATPEFVVYLMQSIAASDGFRDYVGSATIPHLTGVKLATIRIPLPPVHLQKEFTQRVTEIRELETGQSASRRRLEELFQSMLHRAFNGEL